MRRRVFSLPSGSLRLGLLMAAVLAAAPAAAAPELGGSASTYGLASFSETADGKLAGPDLSAAAEALLRFRAEGTGAAFRSRLAAKASASPTGAPAIGFELREAEAAWMPSAALAFRAGLLQRSLGIGSYGSPADPFATADGKAGFWGAAAEWTPSASFSATAAASVDRLARTGVVAGAADLGRKLDGGALARFTPGIWDFAAGFYASGANDGEARPIGYVSLSALGMIATLEGAISIPLRIEDADSAASESIRAELRKSLLLGAVDVELAAAYRGIYPGRDATGIAEVVDAAASGGPMPGDPFAPFYGRHYAEFSFNASAEDRFAFSIGGAVALPAEGLALSSRADIYLGDASFFLKATGAFGKKDGEFRGLARAMQGLGLGDEAPSLAAYCGMEFSF